MAAMAMTIPLLGALWPLMALAYSTLLHQVTLTMPLLKMICHPYHRMLGLESLDIICVLNLTTLASAVPVLCLVRTKI